MSKIQDAIRKIQISRQRQQGDGSGHTQTLAKIADVSMSANESSKSTDELGKKQNSLPTYRDHVVVDREALEEAGLIAPEQEEGRLADEYGQIKRPLVAHAFGKRATKVESGRLIGIVSALPGEGKTFTCINLALSLAQERDCSVLLVDADVAKPHISTLFDLQDHLGLLDLIEKPDLPTQDVLVGTDVDRLTLLSAGRPRSQATELLASERMEQVMDMLVEENPTRIVLFDSSPLLLTNEPRVLAGLMGQVVIVVKAGSTPQSAIEDAINTLDDSKAINLILNQVRHRDRMGYLDGYYGYGSADKRSFGNDATGESQ